MIEELLASEEQIATLKGSSNAGVKSGVKNAAEIERLQKELAKKDLDLKTLKSQATGTNKAYDELVDLHSKASTRSGEVKKDL